MLREAPATYPLVSWTPRALHHVASEHLVFAGHGTALGGDATGPAFRVDRPSTACWTEVRGPLERAAAALAELGIAEIIDVIDRAAAVWCDQAWSRRRAVRDLIAASTGMSAEAVDYSFNLELRNYRAGPLTAALEREFVDVASLDRFVPDAGIGGATRAFGPAVTLQVFTGNVPGLPALEIVRALLVKSSVVAKVASGEPYFASAFVETLNEIDPRFGEAVLVTYWDREDAATLAATVGIADAVVVYGGEASCQAIRAAVPADRLYFEHGHKISLGILSRAGRARADPTTLAAAIAADAVAFNQNACIAPQLYLVEGSEAEVLDFAHSVHGALAAFAQSVPVGPLADDEAAEIQCWRAGAAWRVAESAAAEEGARALFVGGLDYSLLVEPLGDTPAGGGNRRLQLAAVPSLAAALDRAVAFASHLQNVALGVTAAEFAAAAERLARAGASRICAPGRMAEPSLAWRHDGRQCINGLVRWCDAEMHALAPATGAEGGPYTTTS